MTASTITNGKTKTARRFFPTRHDLPLATRDRVVEILSSTLAASVDLKTQIKQAHWNVKGLDFFQLHELFDELAGEIEGYVDMTAERITALGGVALGTARTAARESILSEYPGDLVEGIEHITALAERYAAFGKHLRDAIARTDELGDADTADLYTEISRTIDMRLWFLEAHLHKKEDLAV
ncbi:MAG: DNA starvation/stationary phase protection protein Dps [Cyanobacteriota bacterium]|nr:DNA starvation/stationary phase protection protein Dps [Cyanobacteriota bacterium]